VKDPVNPCPKIAMMSVVVGHQFGKWMVRNDESQLVVCIDLIIAKESVSNTVKSECRSKSVWSELES